MAESSGEKTEMPTPKKLRDARQKGQVCTSKDIVSTAILVVLFVVLGWMGVALIDDGSMLLSYIGDRLAGDPFEATYPAMGISALIICKHSFIFVFVAAVIGIAANTAQIGFLFTFEPLIPKLEKLNPVEGAKKIFCAKNFFEFLKNVVKVSFLSYLLYKIIWASVPELLTMCYGTVDDIFPCLKLMLKRLAVYTAFGYIIIAVVDRLFQGRNFTKQMMMTKDEDGEAPKFGQFTQGSMEPHLAQLRMFASLFAGATKLTIDDMGFPSDNPSSQEAIKAAHENLIIKAQKAQRSFGSGFLNAGLLAASLRDDYTYSREILGEVKPVWKPTFSYDAAALNALGDGIIKINQAVPGFITAETLYDMTGIEPGGNV